MRASRLFLHIVFAAAFAIPASAAATLPQLVIGVGAPAVVGGIALDPADLLRCRLGATGAGHTQCTWTRFFDGDGAGLHAAVDALEVLPDGSLVVRPDADGAVPSLPGLRKTDLARYVDPHPFEEPYRGGSWELFLDGTAVTGADGPRPWHGVSVLADGTCERHTPLTCDVLLSMPTGDPLAGLTVHDEDVFRCTPLAFDARGAITSCRFARFVAPRHINGGETGSFREDVTAFQLLAPDTLLFSAPSAGTLPAHDLDDVLRYVGTFGEQPHGAVDVYFDGSSAGLHGLAIRALGVIAGDVSVPPSTTTTSTTIAGGSSTSTTTMITASTTSTTTTPGGTSSTSTTSPGASSTSTSTTSPGGSSTSTSTTAPGGSSTSTSTTSPGASSTSTSTTSPGGSSTSTSTTSPDGSSTSTSTTTPGGSSTSTSTTPGGSSTSTSVTVATSTTSTTLVSCLGLPDGAPCDDGNPCNGFETCRHDVCMPGTATMARTCRMSGAVAFVTNFADDTVSEIAAATGAVVSTIPVGDGPWGIAIAPDGAEVWVSERAAGTVSVLDPRTGTRLATIRVGGLPLGLLMDEAGTRLYVADFDRSRVLLIDPEARAVRAETRVARGPAALALDPGGTALYVSSYAGATVEALDATTLAPLATLRTGRQPLQMALDAGRARLYVVNYGSGTVSVIGTLSRTVLDTIRVGRKPFGVAVDRAHGRAYVTNASSDTISVVDTATDVVMADVPAGRGPLGIGLSSDGMRAYFATSSPGSLGILDTADGTIERVAVGQLPVAFGAFVGTVGPCAAPPPDCDDADPFTLDSCTPSGCRHDPLSGAIAVDSGLGTLDATLGTAAPVEAAVPTVTALMQEVSDARATLASASHAGRAALARARQRLARVETKIRKLVRRRQIDVDAGLRLLDLTRATKQHAR